MSELSMMVTITERSKLTTFLSFYRERQVPVQFISLALGTASNETLNYLGLERSDKCVFASFVTDEKWEELRRGLRRELQIDVPGMGIAFTVPLSSIGGRRELQFLTEHQNYQKGEESTMKDTKYELLVVIANHGYSDLIMDAARGAGAAGVALCLGADFVKVNPPKPEDGRTPAEALKVASTAAGRTGLVCAGGSTVDAETFLTQLYDQIHVGGADGNATGRNIHQRSLDEAVRLTKAISAITLADWAVADALAVFAGEKDFTLADI